jgi:hypothetical protein
VETEKECNVKTINKVNIRFRADRALRLANESTSLVRTGQGVKFAVADTRTQKKAKPQPQAAVQPQKQEVTVQVQQQPKDIEVQKASVAPAHLCVEKKPDANTKVQKAPAVSPHLHVEKKQVGGRKPVPQPNKERKAWLFGKPELTLQEYIKRRKDEYARNSFEARKELAGP